MSYFGPENLPPLEAMTLGCPVICSNYAGAKEQLGDAADFVDPSSSIEISKALRQVFEDKEWRDGLIRKGLVHLKGDSFSSGKLVSVLVIEFKKMQSVIQCWRK